MLNKVAALITQIFSTKIAIDLVFSFLSFGVLALSGVLINIVVALTHGAEVLGAFNIVYAFYIVISQFSSLGVHLSTLRHASIFSKRKLTLTKIFWNAIIISLVGGIVCTTFIYATLHLFELLFTSELVSKGINIALLGLLLFPATKVIIFFLNGIRQIKFFSICQSLRYITVAGVVVFVSLSNNPFHFAFFCFFAAEILVIILGISFLLIKKIIGTFAYSKAWFIRHLKFGLASLPTNILSEINTRVDVLLIGLILGEKATGVYSFTAMIFDGFFHLIVLIRINLNPILVKITNSLDFVKFHKTRDLIRLYIWPAFALLFITLAIAYHILVVDLHFFGSDFADGEIVLWILLGGLTLLSPLVPFDQILLVSGHVKHQNIQQFLVAGINVLVGVSLIGLIGISGAALGTILGHTAGLAYMALKVRNIYGWNLAGL